VFAQRPLDRRRFFGTVALSMAAVWIGTRDSVPIHMFVDVTRRVDVPELCRIPPRNPGQTP